MVQVGCLVTHLLGLVLSVYLLLFLLLVGLALLLKVLLLGVLPLKDLRVPLRESEQVRLWW